MIQFSKEERDILWKIINNEMAHSWDTIYDVKDLARIRKKIEED